MRIVAIGSLSKNPALWRESMEYLHAFCRGSVWYDIGGCDEARRIVEERGGVIE
jgi:hypothetical protein